MRRRGPGTPRRGDLGISAGRRRPTCTQPLTSWSSWNLLHGPANPSGCAGPCSNRLDSSRELGADLLGAAKRSDENQLRTTATRNRLKRSRRQWKLHGRLAYARTDWNARQNGESPQPIRGVLHAGIFRTPLTRRNRSCSQNTGSDFSMNRTWSLMG
jgi:hypothetical protein